LETGWDNSPRFDNGPTVACDINSYLLMQMRACAELSRMLGNPDEADRQEVHADRYARLMVATLLDRDTGLFWDRSVADSTPVKIKTPACFLPMLAGVPIADAEMKEVIRNQLLNPASFFGSMPFPSVAYDEACYQPDKWWRGPTWLPVAYLMLLLLDKAAYHVEAMNARALLYRAIIRDGNIRELFNSQTGEGLGAYEQGWTAAICLKLNLEISANMQ
jgi:glycogen debranching enzyme